MSLYHVHISTIFTLMIAQNVMPYQSESNKLYCFFHTNSSYSAATINGQWRPMTNVTYDKVNQMDDDRACWLRNDSDKNLGKDSRLTFSSDDGCIIPLNTQFNPVEVKQRIRFICDSITKQHFEVYSYWMDRKHAASIQFNDHRPVALDIVRQFLMMYYNRTLPSTVTALTHISPHSLKIFQSVVIDRYISYVRFDLFHYTDDIMAQAFIYLLLHLGYHKDDPLDNHDIVIFNFGIHGYQDSIDSIRIFIKAWKSLGKLMNPTTTTLPLLVFRETSPLHFFPTLDYKNLDRYFFSRTPYCHRVERISSNAYDFTSYFQSMVTRYNISNYAILHTFNVTVDRYDEHPILHWYNRTSENKHTIYSDCTHFCFRSAVFRYWNGILNVLQASYAGVI